MREMMQHGRTGSEVGLRPGKAQSTLEITVALICTLTILLATLNLFIWLNKRFVLRQRDYEKSRVTSGSIDAVFVDESGYPKLDVFKGWKRW